MRTKYILIVWCILILPTIAFAQSDFNERETSAISVIKADDLEKDASPNPYNTLYGLLPGLSVLQQSDWNANPNLFLRGRQSPLVVVDGFPRSLDFLSTVEIESIEVLKDGAATSIWGTRGANGVILVTTKRGKKQKRDISINYSHGLGLLINQPEMVDGYTYAMARNEALYYDGLDLQYSQSDLDAFRSGKYPELFANTDWANEALRNHTVNNQLDLTFSGGGEKVRYFTALTYKNDFGVLNHQYTKNERYNSQYRKYEMNLRMNLDVDLTPSTLVKWTMLGRLKETTQPRDYDFSLIYNTPSAVYPVKTASGHWGGDLIYTRNPIASFSDYGYHKENPRALLADLRILQDLSSITPGLSAEFAVAYDNYAVYIDEGVKTYSYEVNSPVFNESTNEYDQNSEIYGTDGALSINCWGMSNQYVSANIEGKVLYNRTFNLHAIDVGGIYRLEYYSALGRNNTNKRLYYTGTIGWDYSQKYMVDATFSYVGTSRLQSGNRYRFYPSVSAAWLISKEDFMQNLSFIDFLKLRCSWGQAGSDDIAYDLDKHYWSGYGNYFYGDGNISMGGIKEGTPAINNLTLERVNKYNVGIDLQLLKKLSLTADVYMHKYDNTLIDVSNLYSSVFGNSIPLQNMGKSEYKGFELSATWRDQIGKDLKYYVGANVSRVKSEVIENGEGYKEYVYMSGKGLPVGQIFGLEAIGYFNDQEDIDASPQQQFSTVSPGDIKYKDQNQDNVIDYRDVVAIGHSGSIPEWYGGLQLGLEYKGFGIDLLFQGAAGLSRLLNASSVYQPLRNNTNVSKWYMEDKIRWTEETKDVANMPRLSTLDNANNYQTSTQWLVDGSYLKLRNINVYYNLPKKWIMPLRMENCQVYLRGNNIFSLDHVPYLNCESMSVNYPDIASVYAGVNIKF